MSSCTHHTRHMIPMEKLCVWQARDDSIPNFTVICLDPDFLECNNVVVRASERTSYCGNSFVPVFRDIFQAPASLLEST